MVKKVLIYLFLFVSIIGFSQKVNLENYAVEASYGMTGFIDSHGENENIIAIGHYDIGIRWMKGRTWGAKLDMGSDKTRVVVDGVESGCDYTRFSLQAVCNLNYLVHSQDDVLAGYNPKFNLYTHLGGGYSRQISTLNEGTDNLGNVIFGISPKYKVTKNLNLGVDLTGVVNFSRHFDFDGRKVFNGTRISETGFIYNASITVSYVFWREFKKTF